MKLIRTVVPVLLVCAQAVAVEPWNHPGLSYRRLVALQPASCARTNVPLFVRLDVPAGSFIDPSSVAVDDVTSPSSPVIVASSAWAQPSGEITESFFTAAGVTAVNSQRRFLVYYNLTGAPAAYAWRADAESQWGSYQTLDRNSNGSSDALRLQSDALSLEQSWNEATGRLRTDRQPGYTLLKVLSDGWVPVEGFFDSYLPVTAAKQYPELEPAGAVAPVIVHERDPLQMAVSFQFSPLQSPSNHFAEQTYRLIRGKPWCEFVMTATPGPEDFALSSGDWSWRNLRFADSACNFNRMISDNLGDEPIAETWNQGMRWMVVYNSANSRAAGWFLFRPGVLQAVSAGDTLYDSYAYCVEPVNTFRYLWVFGNSKDSIVALFNSMKPGWAVSEPEGRDVNILQPALSDYFFAEDTLPVEVSTPSGAAGVAAKWVRPNGSEIYLNLINVEPGLRWQAQPGYQLTASDPTGTWHLVVSCGSISTTQAVQVARAVHPRLLFDQAGLEDLRARRFTTHTNDWQNIIRLCEYLEAHPEYPASNIMSSWDIRQYHEWLLALALVHLVDPGQPYDPLLWHFFFTMLEYSTWDEEPIWGGNDLVVGHFLLALALAYDWCYDGLTPADRRDVRERLISYTDRALQDIIYLADNPEPEEADLRRLHGNHLWINFAGVAAVNYALRGEMDESRRQVWEARLEQGFTNVCRFLLRDGSNPEGGAYHSYGLVNLERWMELRRTARGETGATPYDTIPWFTNTSFYTLYSTEPGGADNYGGVAMFGDAPPYHYVPPRDFEPLLAARLRSPVAQWLAAKTEYRVDWDSYQSVWRYLWFDPTVPTASIENLPRWRFFDHQGIFAWRSSWSNDATYLSLKSGMHVAGHGHPDDGSFVLHRAGIPYVVDLGYSFRKETKEHNVLLVDGSGQFGNGQPWGATLPSNQWGRMLSALADDGAADEQAAFFDVLCDPRPTYTNASLTSWLREVLGLGDLFLVRDTVSANRSVRFDLLLHGYVTETSDPAFDFDTHRKANPWTTLGTGRWAIDPSADNPSAPALLVMDISTGNWAATNEKTMFVPEMIPPDSGGGYNEDGTEYQYGWCLRRTLNASGGTSVLAMAFEDGMSNWTVSAWTNVGASGARVTIGASSLIKVLWPQGGACVASGEWDVTGQMAGRRYAQSGGDTRASYFAREATLVRNGGIDLVAASAPVSVFARTEHTPSDSDPIQATLQSKSAATVTLYCPRELAQVFLDGAQVAFAWASGYVTFALPAAGSYNMTADLDDGTPPPLVPPALACSVASISASVTQGLNAASQAFEVWNAGSNVLDYTISDDAAWLSVSPAGGTSTGARNSHAVTYSSAALAAGTYQALITISAPGADGSPKTIAVALHVESAPPPVDVNVALASRGSTITGSNGANWTKLIDGVTTGYTGSSGYGYTYWKGKSKSPGYMQMDLKATHIIHRMKLRLWDLDDRYYRYKIESASSSSGPWKLIVDRRTGYHRSWQDLVLSAPVRARYLRLTGTYNSANSGFHVVEWEAYESSLAAAPFVMCSTNSLCVTAGLGVNPGSQALQVCNGGAGTLSYSISDDASWLSVTPASGASTGDPVTHSVAFATASLPLGSYSAQVTVTPASGFPQIISVTLNVVETPPEVNLALASSGSSITGSNGANWTRLIDGEFTGYTESTGYGYTLWRTAGTMTLDLKGTRTINRMKLLLWDLDSRYYRYKIESAASSSGPWTLLVNRTTGENRSWQDLSLSSPVQARYLRLTGTYNTANGGFHVVEWEVYGY